MNWIRFGIAVFVSWFIYAIGGAVWHEVIFASEYTEWVFGLERLTMPVGYHLITYLMRGIVFVYIYHILYKGGTPIITGARFGFLIGMVTALTVASYFWVFNIPSPMWLFMEFVYNVGRDILMGMVVAIIIGKDQGKMV